MTFSREIWVEADKGEYGMLPSDLIEQIPYAIQCVIGNAELK